MNISGRLSPRMASTAALRKANYCYAQATTFTEVGFL
jgi:hypothetical protein